MSDDRIAEIKEQLKRDDLSSHKRDKLKRELNRLQAQQNNDNGIGAYRTLGVAALALVLVAGIGYALTSAGIVQFGVNNPSGNGSSGEPVDISAEGEPVIGDENAPVTVVEYGDFQCPACQRFDNRIYTQLKQDYIDTGKIKFVWKDFPLAQMHEWAEPAAAAMECTYRQNNDAFWAVKKKVYDNQGSLNQNNVQQKIMDWAAAEGVDRSAVESCIQNDNPMQEVRQDYEEGTSNNVRGTPTVFVNGEKVKNHRYSTYQDTINQALQNAETNTSSN